MIKSALGEETDFQQTESCPCMAKLLLSPVSGTITQIDWDQVERLRQEGLELVLDYPEGHEVSAMADGTDRIGHVIVKTDREAELDEQMKRVYHCIWIDGKIWRQSGKRKQQNKKPESFQDLRRGAKGFRVCVVRHINIRWTNFDYTVFTGFIIIR